MEIQITFTAKVNAPDVDKAAKAIHKNLSGFFDNINFTSPGNLMTSFHAVEIRPGSQITIAFPDNLDA